MSDERQGLRLRRQKVQCYSSSVDRSSTPASFASVDIRKRLGSNVKRLRLEKGWSQEDFADRADIHRTYVSDIERAGRNPTITIVEKLAKALKVTASVLIE